MDIKLHNVQVLKITKRNGEPTANGEVTEFLTFNVLDNLTTRYLWAFSKDFDTLPEAGSFATFDVYVSAKQNKENPSKPKLTLRAKSFSSL
jgi:hypothetical protein